TQGRIGGWDIDTDKLSSQDGAIQLISSSTGTQILLEDPQNSLRQLHLDPVEGLRISVDGGSSWITTVTPEGINASSITTGELNASLMKVGHLIAGVMEANVVEAINANIGLATIDKALIADLDADKITAGKMTLTGDLRIVAGDEAGSHLI